MKKFDEQLDGLSTEFDELKRRLSEDRKKGLYTKIADMEMMNIPAKINLAKATGSQADIKHVKELIDLVKVELDSSEKISPDLDVSLEFQLNNLRKIYLLLGKIQRCIDKNKQADAKEFYLECTELYKKLNTGNKKEIFNKLSELRKLIKEV